MGAAAALALLSLVGPAFAADVDPRLARRVTQLTRATKWVPVTAIRLPFRTFHPQGMVRIGANFYLSSVEVRVAPKRYPAPRDGHDRDTGAGIGHLFKIGPDGRLLADLILGEGSIYHPGGIDFDGSSIWVPVSEYRPDSRAILYKVDPDTMRATEAFRFGDHIGGLVHDTQRRAIEAISWGSRRFYTWPLDADGRIADTAAGTRPVPNTSHYIDYQDCHYAGERRMLCAGVGEYRPKPAGPVFELGGLELVDLEEHRPIWQVPVELWSPSGRSMTQNPFFVEPTELGLRAYFVPDDDNSTLFVFDAVIR